MILRPLDRYRVLLFDLHGTVMFGHDRFDADLYATYRALGGSALDRQAVHTAINRCLTGMLADYTDPARLDDFPTLAEGLQRHAGVAGAELHVLEDVFTQHECGQVPADVAACLQRWHHTHELGLVSNIWGCKDAWLRAFEHAGIGGIWQAQVLSSDGRSIKPSPRIFRRAIDAFDVGAEDMVFIGDSLDADIIPARASGMTTVWVHPGTARHACADFVVPDVLALDHL